MKIVESSLKINKHLIDIYQFMIKPQLYVNFVKNPKQYLHFTNIKLMLIKKNIKRNIKINKKPPI